MDITTSLRTGARIFAVGVQTLNSTISFLNTTKQDLQEILNIADKVVSLAERAADRQTGRSARNELFVEFRRLATEYHRIVDNAKIGDYEVLKAEDISGALELVGLDKNTSDSIAAIFKRFYLSEKDDLLASEYVKGPRPVRIPPHYAAMAGTGPVGTGNGDGSFSAYTTMTTALDVGQKILTGEFTGDSYDDFVVYGSNAGSTHSFELFEGQGDGTFVSRGTFGSGGAGGEAFAVDVNNDGKLDLLPTAQGSGQAIMLSNGNGTFSATACFSVNGSRSVTGLFDSDVYQDAVSVSLDGHRYFYHGNGDGTFDAPTTGAYVGSTSPPSLAVGDIYNNGKLDFVDFRGWGSGEGYVASNVGGNDGSFTTTYLIPLVEPDPVFIALGNMDGDAFPDLVTADGNGVVRIRQGYEMEGGSPFDSTFSPAGYDTTGTSETVSDVKLADINGDSFTDVIALHSGSPSVFGVDVFLGNGDGTLNAPTLYDVYNGSPGTSLNLIDSHNDGIEDIITLSDRTISLVLGNGNGSTAPATTSTYVAVPYHSTDYSSLFADERKLKNQGDGIYLFTDAKEFKRQIEKNIKAIDYALEIVQKNIDLVRGAGFAFLDEASQITSSDEAALIAQQLQTMIRQNAAAALSQAENLNPIVVASLTIEAGGFTYQKG